MDHQAPFGAFFDGDFHCVGLNRVELRGPVCQQLISLAVCPPEEPSHCYWLYLKEHIPGLRPILAKKLLTYV